MTRISPVEQLGARLAFLDAYRRARFPRPFRDRAALARWQETKIQAHLRWVAARSRYYGEVARRLPAARWREWPRMDKATLRARFDELVTVPVTHAAAAAVAARGWERRDFSETLPGGIAVGLSSGTSGPAGLFLVSPREQAAWAGAVLARGLPRALWAGPPVRIAFFLRANSRLYEATRSRRVRFEFFDLLTLVDDHLERLRGLDPNVLVAPPSALGLLARAQLAGRLALRPERVTAVAEVLEAPERELAARAFGQPVIHQVYQATEGFLAATCRHGTLHLNEDLLHVEPRFLDGASGRFVPVVTDFCRRTQPIIRYELDDVLVDRAEPCPCGSPFRALAGVEGRTDDLCALHRPDGATGWLFPDFLRLAIGTADPAVTGFFVRNPRPGELVLTVEPADPALQERVRASVARVCAEGGFAAPAISFGPPPARAPGAKLRRITWGPGNAGPGTG